MPNHVVATAAVEEQAAVTRDMSVNMQDAARAVATIANNITGITSAAGLGCRGNDAHRGVDADTVKC